MHFGNEWSAKASGINSSLKAARASAQKSEQTELALRDTLVPEAETVKLEQAFSAVLLDVYNLRARYGVQIATATPAKLGTGNMTVLTELIDDVPDSSLKSVRINLTGTYETYPGLMDYLKALSEHPTALVRLKVQERGFEASVRVYGTMES